MNIEWRVFQDRNTQENVLCNRVHAVYATNIVCEEISFFYISLDSAEQHIDSWDSGNKRDKLTEWFAFHNLFPNIKQIFSIASGIVGNDQINWQNWKRK